MLIQIDHGCDRPVYLQIADQVKRDVALGRVAEGDRLPTVRELSSRLVINPNTIAKAYRELEHQGIIITRPGSGSYIAQGSSRLSEAVREKLIREQIDRLMVEAIHMQIDRRQLFGWIDEALAKFKFPEKGAGDGEDRG